ncbi:hypothetical protein M0534_03335 [Methylonatrum kenyense]|uniref:hypothetical protein n=1 Tax=Methylonatrum kenyense TaxID=455253 RepID=UPI0020C0E936|nr:hypothetical protein [Methylonatrum kenyense]MCK8515369.1 hypothetical protein [Methylonatrum kenyense]
MSAPHRQVAGTLEEILVAMADGLREAQEALNEVPPIDAFGRPSSTYHLPYLDFAIKVVAETSKADDESAEASMPQVRLASLRRPKPAELRFNTNLLQLPADETSSLEVTSTLSGRFVSVPPGEGMPLVRLQASATKGDGAREHHIEVVVSNSAGERLDDVDVEFNLDLAAGKALSKADGIDIEEKKPATKLASGVVATDDDGVARNRLTFSPAEPRDATFVVAINVGAVSTNLTVTV